MNKKKVTIDVTYILLLLFDIVCKYLQTVIELHLQKFFIIWFNYGFIDLCCFCEIIFKIRFILMLFDKY